jgi:ferritin-like metal-binding protein YciE
MKNHTLHELFIEQLIDMYSSENQIIVALPKLIKLASLPELKEALSHHLKETKGQVEKLETIFTILELSFREVTCKAMKGLLNEAEEIVKKFSKSPTLDAAIIAAAQKVEHYEIASYGTLRSFAKNLDVDRQIVNLLQEILDEEGAADKKLTKLATGSFFSNGINAEAAHHALAGSKH